MHGEYRLAKTVTLIRHAETNANSERRWQGSFDSGLSGAGLAQLERLLARISPRPADVVIASDLDRTMQTASVLTNEVLPDPAWREFHVGAWEGLTTAEIMTRFPGQMEALVAGEDVAPGGGEQMSAFADRIIAAFHALVSSMAQGDRAYVVTHGGVIWRLASHILRRTGEAAPLMPPFNTATTTITIGEDGESQLTVFNDATHLDHVTAQFGPEGRFVTLVRHGETEGNLVGVWQGHSDSALTETGEQQAKFASMCIPEIGALYTSPLGRTRQTAGIIGDALGVTPKPHDGFKEMAFGSWENLTSHEAAELQPELFSRIYDDGLDLPRGGSGETFGQAGKRVAETVESLVDLTDTDFAAVSHGAAIRAYIVHITGMTFAERDRLPIPRNTSMSSVIYAGRRPVLAHYNVAPHLDR